MTTLFSLGLGYTSLLDKKRTWFATNTHLYMAGFNQQLGEFEPLFSKPIKGYSATELQELRQVRLLDFVDTEDYQNGNTEDGLMNYMYAWNLQKQLVQYQFDRLLRESGLTTDDSLGSVASSQWLCHQNEEISQGKDCVIMLQHTPVYTLGTGSDESFIKETTKENASIDIVRVERGGEVTYHGPGQLVVYPILDLRGYKKDIHWYMRALEEAIIMALESAGVKGVSLAVFDCRVFITFKKKTFPR